MVELCTKEAMCLAQCSLQFVPFLYCIIIIVRLVLYGPTCVISFLAWHVERFEHKRGDQYQWHVERFEHKRGDQFQWHCTERDPVNTNGKLGICPTVIAGAELA